MVHGDTAGCMHTHTQTHGHTHCATVSMSRDRVPILLLRCELCGLGQVTWPPCASVFSSQIGLIIIVLTLQGYFENLLNWEVNEGSV